MTAHLASHILDNLNTAILWLDTDLRLQYMNSAAEALLAISAKQATGHKITHFILSQEGCGLAIRKTVENRCPMIERELNLHLTGAKKITVDCSIIPIIDNQHRIEAFLIELTQIDQHHRTNRDEALMQQQITRNMLRGLAHEIKNPLGGLRGAAQLLERALPSDELREYTSIIIGEADRLQNLMQRILGPNTPTTRAYTNVHHVLMHVRQLLLSEVDGEIKVECDFDPSIPDLWANADQLVQATLNIVRNAAQAMNNHGHLQLRTRICRQMRIGDKLHKLLVRIDIIDNGPGIAETMVEQIFYPMVTGRADGTGLGLSIAQSLVNQHGGLIECSSQPQHTVFTLWLPIETASLDISPSNFVPKENPQ